MFSINCNMIFKPFNGKVNFTTRLNYSRYNYKNIYSGGNFKPEFHAKLFLGNWSLSAGVNGSDKVVDDGGSKITKRPWNYYLFIDYGNGNLNLNLSLFNPFNKYGYENICYANGPYNYNSRSIQEFWSRKISISLTYTFDYGKKIDKRIDISESGGKNTSVLGSK